MYYPHAISDRGYLPGPANPPPVLLFLSLSHSVPHFASPRVSAPSRPFSVAVSSPGVGLPSSSPRPPTPRSSQARAVRHRRRTRFAPTAASLVYPEARDTRGFAGRQGSDVPPRTPQFSSAAPPAGRHQHPPPSDPPGCLHLCASPLHASTVPFSWEHHPGIPKTSGDHPELEDELWAHFQGLPALLLPPPPSTAVASAATPTRVTKWVGEVLGVWRAPVGFRKASTCH